MTEQPPHFLPFPFLQKLIFADCSKLVPFKTLSVPFCAYIHTYIDSPNDIYIITCSIDSLIVRFYARARVIFSALRGL